VTQFLIDRHKLPPFLCLKTQHSTYKSLKAVIVMFSYANSRLFCRSFLGQCKGTYKDCAACGI